MSDDDKPRRFYREKQATWMDLIEPDAVGSNSAIISIAISLKRIADAMDPKRLFGETQPVEITPFPQWRYANDLPPQDTEALVLTTDDVLEKAIFKDGKWYSERNAAALEIKCWLDAKP